MKKTLLRTFIYALPHFIVLTLMLPHIAAAEIDNKVSTNEETPTLSRAIPQEPKPADMGELTPGPLLEQELAGGKSHSYRVRLAANQYLKVVVNQKGIDVVVLVFGPEGRKLTEVDNTGGPETIFAVAETAGEYRVEVRTADSEAPAGKYEIGLAELRESTARDRVAVVAERLYEEGNQLRDQRTAESRR